MKQIGQAQINTVIQMAHSPHDAPQVDRYFHQADATWYRLKTYDKIQYTDDQGQMMTLKLDHQSTPTLLLKAPRYQFHFQTAQRTQANYPTPYGSLQVEIDTHRLHWHYHDQGIDLVCDYTLSVGDEVLSEHQFTLQFKEIISNIE